jgi:hypothetical protein
MKRTIFALAAAMLLTLGAAASGSNGVEISKQVIPQPDIYVPCLGETTAGVVEVTIYGRYFYTPSGVGHLIDNWRMTAYRLGKTTGRIWIGHGFSPWIQNGVEGGPSVLNVRTSLHFKPFNDNGSFPTFPDLRFAWRAKLTVNANGEVTAFEPFPEDSDSFKCIGPGY